jgi:hypothetical protein
MSNLINNEFMSWVVKGHIARMKDHDVNWAQAIVSTIKEKAHRLVIERMKSISFYMGQS